MRVQRLLGRLAVGAAAGWVHQHGAWPWVLAFAVLVTGSLAAALRRRIPRAPR